MTVRTWTHFALLIGLTLAVYYPSLFAPFNSLDDRMLVQHLINREDFSWAQHFSPGGRGEYYRPLISLSFAFDKLAWGLEESFMHLENIFLHAVNAGMVFLIALRLFRYNGLPGKALPFVVASMFALHPINTEAVNWITARTDVFAATWVYASLYTLLVFLETHKTYWGVLGSLFFLLGCLCKEPALFFLPGVLLLVWQTLFPTAGGINRPAGLSRVVVSLAYLMTTACYFMLRWLAFHYDRGIDDTVNAVVSGTPPGSPETTAASFGTLFYVLLKATGFYFKKFFWPFPLNFGIVTVSDAYVYLGIIVVLLVVWLLLQRTLLSSIGLIGLFLAASALLVVINQMAWTPLAERYIYIATGPFLLFVFFSLARLTRVFLPRNVTILAVFALLTSSAYATVTRNLVWQDNLLLYQDTVRKSPTNHSAKNELALALGNANRQEEANEIISTLPIPVGQASFLNKASLLIEQEEYDEARAFLLGVLEDPGPHEREVLEYLIQINGEVIKLFPEKEPQRPFYREIIVWLTRLQELTHDPFHWYRLGRVYLLLQEPVQARNCFAEAARKLPESSPYKQPAQHLALKLAQQ